MILGERRAALVLAARLVIAAAVLVGCGGTDDRAAPDTALDAAPEPAPVFREVDVSVGTGPLSLPGTLTLPTTGGPHPAVVILGGSGPTDKDGTLAANKPLRDLAHGLAPHGVAVLRYDKRSKVHPADLVARAETTMKEEYVDDAVIAVDLLRKRPEVQPAKVFVLGHSQGALAAPRVAVAEPAVAGLILMAAPTERFEDTLVRQVTYLTSVDGSVSGADQASIDQARRDAQAVRDLASGAPSVGPLPFSLPRSYVLDLVRYDPVVTVRALPQPMLILQGGRDYQVRPQDLSDWAAGLAGRDGVTTKLYPRANHLFIDGDGPSSPADYQRPGNVAREVVDDIAAWVNTRP